MCVQERWRERGKGKTTNERLMKTRKRLSVRARGAWRCETEISQDRATEPRYSRCGLAIKLGSMYKRQRLVSGRRKSESVCVSVCEEERERER